jgi:octaprenyl-diphosphate synthase
MQSALVFLAAFIILLYAVFATGKNMATIIPLKNVGEKPRVMPGEDALERLTALVATDMAAVNHLIVQRMESRVPLIPQLAGHLIAAGGKRLRPVLTLASALLCGYKGTRHRKLAACVEFIHTATLLHDDVVDASALRRGNQSANAMFGNQASVLVGDFLFSRAFQLMVEDGSIDVLRILSNASAVISEGEVLQLTTTNDSATSEQAYLEVVAAKTAELFAAACRIGAIVAGRPAAEEEALRTFGLNLGIAYQIVDDVLDYSAEQQRLGKTIGDDFREGKITLPIILAMHRGSEAERAFWRRALDEHVQHEGDLAYARDILHRHNALRDSLDRARHYGAIAHDALGLFADCPVKTALLNIVDFTLERGF